jgi:SAM-dependent methyltransferase
MKRDYPATGRNRDAILEVLRPALPPAGLVLEIASGSGQHAAYFAPALAPRLRWQPTDRDPELLPSIAAWSEGLANVLPPVTLDVTERTWPVARADAIFCANMIHIAPWAACEGLMRGAGRILPPRGLLALYGPFMRGGEHTAPSNARFDSSLRARDPAWGVRDLDAVAACAAAQGLRLEAALAMPANNLTVLLRREGAAAP